MLIYLDLNCFNRPFDDQSQQRIAEETDAVFRILERVSGGIEQLVWSEVLDFENSRHPLADRRTEIGRWRYRAEIRIGVDDRVTALAEELTAVGLAPLDAAHLACAEVAGCEAFLTCDDRLIRRSERRTLRLSVRNPVDFVEELENG